MQQANTIAVEEIATNARLLLKHAVGGRTFLDSAKTPVRYRVASAGTGWRIEIELGGGEEQGSGAEGQGKGLDALQNGVPGNVLGEVLRWRKELNLFLFEEERQPVRKNWFYVQDVSYEASAGKLVLHGQGRLSYVPDDYTW